MRRKRQPTADMLRQQLALAADEIIKLRAQVAWFSANAKADALMTKAVWYVSQEEPAMPWWRRLVRWFS